MRIRLFAAVLSCVAAPACAGPAFFCELYAPGHFGDWYEVAGEREMHAVLQEARHWGFNCYGDWYDTLDCTDPFSGDPQYSLGNALWDAKKAHFRTAQSLGRKTDPVITPNHVFRDQLNRKVYGLGPLRHILGPSFIGLPLHKSWLEHQQMTATRPASPDA